MRRFTAVSIVLQHEGKILMLKRANHVRTNPGRWSVVAGEVEKGETMVQAARREVSEETQLSPAEYRLKTVGEPVKIHPKADVTTVVYPFLFEATQANIKLNEEHTEFLWVQPEDALKRDVVPQFQDILRNLHLSR